jgi:hypothetical protein
MDPQDIIDVCRVLRRHEESLANNEISLISVFSTIHNMERKQQEQYDRIMDILGEYGGQILKIEMDCYNIKCYV